MPSIFPSSSKWEALLPPHLARTDDDHDNDHDNNNAGDNNEDEYNYNLCYGLFDYDSDGNCLYNYDDLDNNNDNNDDNNDDEGSDDEDSVNPDNHS